MTLSWKAVEMQVALPRTQDVGKIQEQIEQRGQFMQHAINQQAKSEDVIKRHSVNETEKQRLLREEEKKKKEQQLLKHELDQKKQNKATQQHPFLGRRIDMNG